MACLKADAKVLAEVEQRLKALVTPGSKCTVPEGAKEAVALYVKTWILQGVRDVRRDLAGEAPLPYWRRQLMR